jgi:hypothetical protein
MRNETSRIDREAGKYAEKTLMPYGSGSLVRLGLFIVAISAACMIGFVVLLHVAEVIP